MEKRNMEHEMETGMTYALIGISVSQNWRGCHFGGPYSKEYNMLQFYIGFPFFGAILISKP